MSENLLVEICELFGSVPEESYFNESLYSLDLSVVMTSAYSI